MSLQGKCNEVDASCAVKQGS